MSQTHIYFFFFFFFFYKKKKKLALFHGPSSTEVFHTNQGDGVGDRRIEDTLFFLFFILFYFFDQGIKSK